MKTISPRGDCAASSLDFLRLVGRSALSSLSSGASEPCCGPCGLVVAGREDRGVAFDCGEQAGGISFCGRNRFSGSEEWFITSLEGVPSPLSGQRNLSSPAFVPFDGALDVEARGLASVSSSPFVTPRVVIRGSSESLSSWSISEERGSSGGGRPFFLFLGATARAFGTLGTVGTLSAFGGIGTAVNELRKG